jgi:hypothetical protein
LTIGGDVAWLWSIWLCRLRNRHRNRQTATVHGTCFTSFATCNWIAALLHQEEDLGPFNFWKSRNRMPYISWVECYTIYCRAIEMIRQWKSVFISIRTWKKINSWANFYRHIISIMWQSYNIIVNNIVHFGNTILSILSKMGRSYFMVRILFYCI